MPQPPKNQTPDVPAHVVAARRAAAERLVRDEINLERQAKVTQALVPDDRHPADADVAASELERHTEARKKADEVIKANGLSRKDIETGLRATRRDELSLLILTWKQTRAVHQDYLDNPALYGGFDQGGSRIVPEDQLRMIAELDAAIAVAEAEKASLA